MHELAVALVWHQHQPYYPDDVTHFNPMPWVRLHGAKDYWGMAMHLAEVPEVHATINFVPSLLAQIRAYTDDKREDEHLRVSRMPADGLIEADRLFLLDNFFMAHPDQMIRPYPRYWELYQQRGLHTDSATRASKRFSTRDVLDLQCWNNLIWFHPIAFERDKDLAEFRRKGQDWSEDEKQWLLNKQLEILAEVIPLHRKLARQGQIELTTTPYYHPILPLLVDMRLARQAMPHVELPRHLECYAKDADEQIRRGVAYHTEVFGMPPAGMWPSEGSVAQAIIPLIAAHGIRWIASDEEILTASTNGWISRDAQGLVQHPEMLYRPWRVEEGGHALQMIFRDHGLSDLIGFQYQRYEADQAADDLIGKLEAVGQATGLRGKAPALVSLILDGENCWEYYPDGGLHFLRAMYQRLAKHPQIKPVRVAQYLDKYPASDKLGNLFAGSWISHNFAIWIGQPTCNMAWDLLSETRAMLVAKSEQPGVPKADLALAWEELYIAEGSDWFWWFDQHHSSSQDWLFDQLFRRHLQNVYALVDEEPPAVLAKSIGPQRAGHPGLAQPTGLLNVKINGRETYFEWVNAGLVTASSARGTMTMAEEQRVIRLHFGFDEKRLLLRFDTVGPARTRLADVELLRIVMLQPAGFELLVSRPGDARPSVQLFHNDVPVSSPGGEAASDIILELGVGWRSLVPRAESPLHFYAELIANGQSIERIPHEGAIETFVPSADYELMMWQA